MNSESGPRKEGGRGSNDRMITGRIDRALMKKISRLLLLATVVIACVSCDQVTQAVATSELSGRAPISFLGDTIRLTYAENAGGFLSFGANLSEPLRSASCGTS